MAIPDYQTIMLPLLRFAADSQEHRFRDAVEQLALEFELTDAERSELLPSGTAPVFDNRVGWARTYLKQAGLLQSPKRGVLRITESGKALLADKPDRINVDLLDRYAEFQAFRTRRRDRNEIEPHEVEVAPVEDQTPEDTLAAAYQKLRKNLESDLLEQIKTASPTFFERLVIDLLVSMGYGALAEMQGAPLARAVTAASTGSSRKTNSDLT